MLLRTSFLRFIEVKCHVHIIIYMEGIVGDKNEEFWAVYDDWTGVVD